MQHKKQWLNESEFVASDFVACSIKLCNIVCPTLNLSTTFLLHLEFSQSKYYPTAHDLSHLHSQLLRFQTDPLSHTPLSITFFHSHLYLSSFQRCLLLQTLASNLHLHLHISCHSMRLVSLVLDIRLNILTSKFLTTSETHSFAYGLLIFLQLPLLKLDKA